MTYLAMRTRIQSELVRTDIDGRINEAIISAIRHWERERFFFNEATTTFVTVADQEQYTESDGVPTGLVKIDELTVDVNSTTYPLTPRTYSFIENIKNSTSYTGFPYSYAYYQESFWPYPIPNGSYTLNLSYIQRLAEVTLSATDAATNAWMVEAEDLIRLRAKSIIRIDVLEQERAKAEAAMMAQKGSTALSIMEDSVLQGIQGEVTKRVQTGRVQPTQF